MQAGSRLWRNAPFLRLLLPFSAGILLQWYIPFSLPVLLISGAVFLMGLLLYQLLPLQKRFKWFPFAGLSVSGLFAATGAVFLWQADIRHQRQWIGHYNQPGYSVVATLQEPLVEKQNSYKARARIEGLYRNDRLLPATGQVLLYFKKEPSVQDLCYGTQLLLHKPLQEISNAGNPGSFDYKQYTLFQGITHQAFLDDKDFVVLPKQHTTAYQSWRFRSRSALIALLQRYIQAPQEQALAEALLVGYKDDLDKNLVQAYSNTGVVHIIAISGLHLGLIYLVLFSLTKPLKRKQLQWLRYLIILTGLWLFSLLVGAQPSVLRSAVMFSTLAISTVLSRKANIYNTLALSAFLLLCYHPFWLWDVGFQLSFAAVLSIIVYYRPIYNLLYFQNKLLDYVWKLLSVSLAAQVLTLPVSLYHFHQFPVLFLFANLIAVPCTFLVLIGEIVLCAVSFLPPVARLLGIIIEALLRFMNDFIERLNRVPFAVWNGLYISVWQVLLLYGFLAGISWWLLEKKRTGVWIALVSLILFTSLRTFSFIKANQQKKIIVYNVPRHQAIDLIDGRTSYFIGDASLREDAFLRNFHLQPSRVLHRIQEVQPFPLSRKAFSFYGKKVLVIDTTLQWKPGSINDSVDVAVLSKNPRLYLQQLTQALPVKQIVIDGSVPAWKARLWQHACDSLHLPCHDVSSAGAFVLNLE